MVNRDEADVLRYFDGSLEVFIDMETDECYVTVETLAGWCGCALRKVEKFLELQGFSKYSRSVTYKNSDGKDVLVKIYGESVIHNTLRKLNPAQSKTYYNERLGLYFTIQQIM